MKKKKSIYQKVLDDMGLESPKRHVRKQKPRPYPPADFTLMDLAPVYGALKKMLMKYKKRFVVDETETSYYLSVPMKDQNPYSLFGVSIHSGWVTFHHIALLDKNYEQKRFPKKLRERRHGQTVLNFIDVDQPLFKVLEKEIQWVIKAVENSGYFD